MKKLKKTLAVLLAATMVLGLLAACDDGSADVSDPPDSSATPAPATDTYPITPEELGSGEVKWSEEETDDGWMMVTNDGGETLGYSPDSGVKLIQVDGFAFKDLNKNGQLDAYEDWRLDVDVRAFDLASQLSVDEMAGMMIVYSYFSASDEPGEMQEPIDMGIRFINSFATSYPAKDLANWNNNMQALAEASEHGVPVATSTNPRNTNAGFPDNLGLAASFDPDVVLETAKMLSKEYRAIGITSLLGPQADVASEPRWSRVNGTFGEDPALVRDMTSAYIYGTQSTFGENGEDLGWGADSVNTQVKHWPGDGVGESGRESHDAFGQFAVYPGGQFETSLIPFVDGGLQSCGNAGQSAGVMTSYSIAWSDDEEYGDLVGSAFSEYKIELLRSYGFDGIICSDFGILKAKAGNMDVDMGWGVADLSNGERCYEAISAGIDQIGGSSEVKPMKEAYELMKEEEGEEAATQRFQESARRLMKYTLQTGIFENPYVDVANAVEIAESSEMQEAGYEAQLKSIVMLKNEDNTIKAADGSNTEKPTVYIPYVYSDNGSKSAATLPVDLATAREYFTVVTDKVSETLTGPADAEGKPTVAYEDIIRATPEELAGCDYALVFVSSPQNVVDGMTSPGYDRETESYIPISLQYSTYTADSESVRLESIAGPTVVEEVVSPYGVQYVNTKQNCTYYGKTAQITNATDLDAILYAVNNMPEDKKVIVAIDADNPMVVSEFEEQVDVILMGFDMNEQTIMDIVTGQYEPSGLLPLQMPANMETVEAQYEDVPRDMECYVDAAGNTYDFGFGLNWSGVIQDERTEKYCVPALTEPATQPVE